MACWSPARDAGALAEGMLRMLAEPGRLEPMGRAKPRDRRGTVRRARGEPRDPGARWGSTRRGLSRARHDWRGNGREGRSGRTRLRGTAGGPGVRPAVPGHRRVRHRRPKGGGAAPRPRSQRRDGRGDAARARRSRFTVRSPRSFAGARSSWSPCRRRSTPTTAPTCRPSCGRRETVGKVLSGGAVVVYESTVYPGVTEEICGPVLERESGLRAGTDFTLGYSPERINPGDKEHTLERITKVVSGQDAQTLDRVAAAYGRIVTAGVHRAPSIKVAEAAKVIENTQRDLNIALMNELALIFDRLGIRTADVLAAARTKWNFLPFTPGPRRRPLHRRRPVLPDHQGRAARLPARGDPRGAAHQQRDGRVHRREAREDAHQRRPAGEGGARRDPRAHVQGGRLRHAQQQGAGHRAGARSVRDPAARPRSAVRAR